MVNIGGNINQLKRQLFLTGAGGDQTSAKIKVNIEFTFISCTET